MMKVSVLFWFVICLLVLIGMVVEDLIFIENFCLNVDGLWCKLIFFRVIKF